MASLHDAVKHGDLERVQALLSTAAQKRALANKRSAQGRPPLHLAAEGGHLAVAEALIAAGARLNETEDGFGCGTALMWAAAKGHLAVVKALLAAGADPRCVAHDGSTAEGNAREGGFDDIVEVLRGAVEEWTRELVLHVSAEAGAEELLLTLRTLGGSVAGTLSWQSARPVAQLPKAALEALKSSGFQAPFEPLRLSNLRFLLASGKLLDTSSETSLLHQMASE